MWRRKLLDKPNQAKASQVKLNSEKSLLLCGSSHPGLAEEVSKLLSLPIAPLTLLKFPDGEQRVQLQVDVLGKQVFVIQSLAKAPNELLIETLLLVDALRRQGAKRIVLVSPYLAYSRQNVQETEGYSVAARLFADFLQKAGVDHLITIDLHSDVVGSFYTFPVEHLTARDALLGELIKQKVFDSNFVIVGPDLGSAKLAARFSKESGCSLALIQKRRDSARQVTMLSLLGEVSGKNVLLADDVCSTAGTLTSASFICREKGAKKIFAVVSHGLFVEEALSRIEESPIERLFVSDSVPLDPKAAKSTKICVISIAKVLATSLSRLIERFEEQ
jgi:ribose-phosphate pyrophosphokinase